MSRLLKTLSVIQRLGKQLPLGRLSATLVRENVYVLNADGNYFPNNFESSQWDPQM